MTSHTPFRVGQTVTIRTSYAVVKIVVQAIIFYQGQQQILAGQLRLFCHNEEWKTNKRAWFELISRESREIPDIDEVVVIEVLPELLPDIPN